MFLLYNTSYECTVIQNEHFIIIRIIVFILTAAINMWFKADKNIISAIFYFYQRNKQFVVSAVCDRNYYASESLRLRLISEKTFSGSKLAGNTVYNCGKPLYD